MQKNDVINKMVEIFNSVPQKFGKGIFYQSYEPLGIDGMRKTKLRFDKYKINKWVNKNSLVLDVGCNCGFFSCYVARYVKEVDAIDENVSLIEMGKLLSNFENLNVRFYCDKIENFNFIGYYDFIFAAAIHGWVDFSPETLVDKLFNLLKDKGKILFESHRLKKGNKVYKDDVYDCIMSLLPYKMKCIFKNTIIDDDRIKRKFSIWEKY